MRTKNVSLLAVSLLLSAEGHRMILIISFPDNDHVSRVTEYLTQPFVILDLASIPAETRLHAYAGRDRDALYLDLPSGQRIDLDRIIGRR